MFFANKIEKKQEITHGLFKRQDLVMGVCIE